MASKGRTVPATPFVLLVLAAGLAWGAGRLLSRRARWLVPAAVTAGMAGVFLAYPHAFDSGPLVAPTGYLNANATLASLGAAACAILSVLVRPRLLRPVAWLAGWGFVALPALSQTLGHRLDPSAGGTIAGALVLLAVAVVTLRPRTARTLILAVPVLVLAAGVWTAAVGALYRPGAAHQDAIVTLSDRVLTERRSALWHDAVVIAAAHPVRGVGPDGFAQASPVARRYPYARWAHSVWLQQAADQGLVGLGVLLLAAGWLWWPYRSRHDPQDVVAAWVLGGVLLAASVDYVLFFPAVTLLWVGLVGSRET